MLVYNSVRTSFFPGDPRDKLASYHTARSAGFRWQCRGAFNEVSESIVPSNINISISTHLKRAPKSTLGLRALSLKIGSIILSGVEVATFLSRCS